MYSVALKMLFGDRVKFITLVVGLTFSVLLITQQGSIFWGIMSRFLTTIRNTAAPIWVMEPATEMVDSPNPMNSTDLPRVLSVDGVKWAKPMHLGAIQVKTRSGLYRNAQMIGLDADTLIGLPQTVLSGNIMDINSPNTIIVDNNELYKLGNPKVGDVLEINDQEARIVAIVKSPPQFFGYPFIFTTYERSEEYTPPQRKHLSYVLVSPQSNVSVSGLVQKINQETGLQAIDEDSFKIKTFLWYLKNTGIPINFGITVALGVIIGAAVAAQTFYTFTIENQRHFGTLKALGVSNGILTQMVLLQSAIVGFIGYGMGLGILSIFGSTVPKISRLAFNTPWPLLIIGFLAVVIVCIFSSLISIRRITRIEPAIVFRG